MKSRFLLVVLGGWLALAAIPVGAQEPLAEKVKLSIKKAVSFLRQQQDKATGGWTQGGAAMPEGGVTCLAMLALLEAGEPLTDKMMMDGLKAVRNVNSNQTYVRALQTQVLAKAGQIADKIKINQNIEWLVKARVFKGKDMTGWGYGFNPDANLSVDGSNTQFALLGLWAGKDAGIKIDEAVWKSIRDHYISTQQENGTWLYTAAGANAVLNNDRMTMTTAGICGLLLSGLEVQEGRETIQANGKVVDCGQYKENENLAKALKWMGEKFHLEVAGRTFYNFYSIERLGRLTGYRFFGAHDWYREGCDYLVKGQDSDGSWTLVQQFDKYPVINASFALLFLSKGRTPVLISKLVHGDWPRDTKDNDWNRDRNAVKNLTDFVGKEIFTAHDKAGNKKPLPLAWQIFDLMQALTARGNNITDKNVQAITAEMLQSPIIFLNGHHKPRLTPIEKELLKNYVENGGFIVAEACCGSKDFDQGFKELVKDAGMWPNNDLVPLSADHPVRRFPYNLPAKTRLYGLEMGCKTVLIYSPDDLSCLWEANKYDENFGAGVTAFRTGANIVAYATGMIPPLPRLTEINIAGKETDTKNPPRFFLKIAQLVYSKNWTPPAPAAVRNLMSHLRQFAGLDVVLKPENIKIDHEDLANFKFIYFHDRNAFTFQPEELKQLKFNLETGGLLFADACCGSKQFDGSFRKFIEQELFPKHKLVRVPPDDPLFGAALNGKALTKENIKGRQTPGAPLEPMLPFLEGIKIDGRWVVLYSKYDIGCALERHAASECIGYDHASALKIASAAVLYLMSP